MKRAGERDEKSDGNEHTTEDALHENLLSRRGPSPAAAAPVNIEGDQS